MARDFEDRLRQSLQARAEDVTPDPQMFRDVQSRIRRGRMMRWSLTGAGAVAIVAIGALAFPALTDRRVEFEPAPVATQPPSEEHSYETTAPPCSNDGDVLVAVMARDDGELHALCASGREEPVATPPVDGVKSAPALSADGTRVAYVVAEDHEIPERVEVVDLATGDVVDTVESAQSPAFSPAGNLAFVRDEFADGEEPRLVVQEGAREAESPMVPDDIAEDMTARHLVWAAGDIPRILYWEARDEGQRYGSAAVWGDDYIEPEPWRFEPDAGARYAAPSSRQDARLHLLRTCCVETGIDPPERVELGVLTLPDPDAQFEPIATLPDGFDARGRLSLTAAGTADIDETTGEWTSGDAPAWLVGDGDLLYLVDEDGNTDLVDEGVMGVAFNRAAELPASPDAPPSPSTLAQVDVHFAADGSECGEDVEAFPRSVEGPAVLRRALEEQLGGPTPEEMQVGASRMTGFSGATTGLLNDVSIADNGVARIDFSGELAEHLVSTACMSALLFQQLEPTVRQFPSVEEVVYSFDGSIEDFYTEYQFESPPHRTDVPVAVTRMQERIRDALDGWREGDDAPLAELIDRETFSCSFSDQNEDCVALWRQQEAGGHDPLGPLEELLWHEGEWRQPVKNPEAPIWVWPQAWLTDESYLGPRTGIQRDGTWRYYQQGGD